MYYAHSGSTWEPLRVHLLAVAERAASYASAFGAAEEARLAGLLHDLGKYSDLFTARLHGEQKGLDHWSAGAWAALRLRSPAAALAIQGHHVGLQQGSRDGLLALDPARLSQRHPLGLRLTEAATDLLLERLRADGLDAPVAASSLYNLADPTTVAGMLDVRMLFSALVDADFLETEAHFKAAEDGTRHRRQTGPDLEPGRALDHLQGHMAGLARTSPAAPAVAALRNDLLAACLDAAGQPPGLFTLSAPTGAGKTLAMLAFALRHAAAHGLRRIVLAIPYLSILEQTARIYRDLFSSRFEDNYVLEHHSLAGTRREPGEGRAEDRQDQQEEPERLARWLTENWDAPLILTTNVQLLESLFANRPSACRKLHRLAGSVILFDEVQTLPPHLAVPTLAALSRLAERYGASVVFATATQPAFDHLDGAVGHLARAGWKPREIVPPGLGLFARARRTRVRWDIDRPLPWDTLADELAGHEQVLCIVNLKRHARLVAEKLRQRNAPGLFHLSTNLCPAHRERVLAEVRRRLRDKEPCRLVATQCVEAGVDVDFPRVFRALGPLEAVAQAAGRCNRNGNLPGLGEVRVFRPEEAKYPPGGYQQATEATSLLLKDLGAERMEDVQDPELFRRYYVLLYELARIAEVSDKIRNALEARSFEEVARCYRLIDQDAISVLVPYDLDGFTDLRAELSENHLNAGWIRRARPHTVSLYRPKATDPLWNHLDPAPLGKRRGKEVEKDPQTQEWFVYLDENGYDRDLLGLVGPADDLWIA